MTMWMNSLNVGTPSILQDSKMSLGILDIPAVRRITSYPIPAQTQKIQIKHLDVADVTKNVSEGTPSFNSNCPTGPVSLTEIEKIVVKIIKGITDGRKKIILKNPFAKIFLKMKYEKNKAIGKVTKQETTKNAKEAGIISP